MKAITLHQPYASGVALGCKPDETRGFRTHYRGSLAIHAGLFTPVINAAVLANAPEAHRAAFVAAGYHLGGKPSLIKLPQGNIVAIVELYDCIPVEEAADTLTPEVKHWGIYKPGRWIWRLRNVRRLASPIFIRGKQGLWDWTPPADLQFVTAP